MDIMPSREHSINHHPASQRSARLFTRYSTKNRRNGSWIWPVQQLLRSSREPGKSTAAVLLPECSYFCLTTHDRVIQCALLPELRQQLIQYSATWSKYKRTRHSILCESGGCYPTTRWRVWQLGQPQLHVFILRGESATASSKSKQQLAVVRKYRSLRLLRSIELQHAIFTSSEQCHHLRTIELRTAKRRAKLRSYWNIRYLSTSVWHVAA